MSSRVITFPPTVDMTHNKGSTEFGLSEYLLENAFVRPEAFSSSEANDLANVVIPQLREHRKQEQVGWELTLSESQWELLMRLARPEGPINPLVTLEISTLLRALYTAKPVP